MSSIARKAVVPFSEANKKYVSSLYRKSLRTAHDWINKTEFYRVKASEIRSRYDANKHINDPNELKVIFKETEALLEDYAHPDPIIPPCRPGGSKFERNIPPRVEARIPIDV
ncbi:hypothetical protein LJB42_002377 [Komagataella kurtzmanii]|nr:hypothetical protein LJB42_002377 [Komagataella kurtzmanii]